MTIPQYASRKHKREGAVSCANCQYFKEQNKDRTGLCLIVDHKKVMAWVERSPCIVGHDESCDFGMRKAAPAEFIL